LYHEGLNTIGAAPDAHAVAGDNGRGRFELGTEAVAVNMVSCGFGHDRPTRRRLLKFRIGAVISSRLQPNRNSGGGTPAILERLYPSFYKRRQREYGREEHQNAAVIVSGVTPEALSIVSLKRADQPQKAQNTQEDEDVT